MRYLIILFMAITYGICEDNVKAVGNLAGELNGLVVHGSITQVIGNFNTYGHIRPADTFEIDLTNLPKEKIDFIHPSEPKRDFQPYVPFKGLLTVEKVEIVAKPGDPGWGKGCAIISLTTGKRDLESLIIEVWADELKKGSAARIYIYSGNRAGIIGSMAEAEGVLK